MEPDVKLFNTQYMLRSAERWQAAKVAVAGMPASSGGALGSDAVMHA